MDDELNDALFPKVVRRTAPESIDVTPSEFTEFAIRIPGGGEASRFSFEGRPYLKQIYNTPAKRIMLKSARQPAKYS